MKLNFVIIILTAIVLLCSCNASLEKGEKKLHSDSTLWIFDDSALPDSLKDGFENYMIIDSVNILFNNYVLGEFRLSNDTVRIVNISYLQLSIDSMQKQESLVFEGIITRYNRDTLVFKRLRGYFPLRQKNVTWRYQSEKISFFNERLFKKRNFNLQKISFSSSTCYGKCPAMAFEMDNTGKINFFGGAFSKKAGYYSGKVNKGYFDKVKNIISYINMERDTTTFPVPIDAPINEIIIYADNRRAYFTGYLFNSPLYLYKLNTLLLNISENCELIPVKDTMVFETMVYRSNIY